MEFEKETSFIHVDGKTVLTFAVLVLILSILGYLLWIHIRKVSITRPGNMRFLNETR